MEFEFRRNRLDGTVFAEFSMEHAVLGRWFAQELGKDLLSGQAILAQIQSLQAGKQAQFFQAGKDISLDMDQEQVRVFVNSIDFDEDFELDEDMSLYDMESEAFCGLEDFEQVLRSWLNFLQQD
ncbi:YacL family protein [Shewanella sp. SR44-3]|uniref:YacL family protein n=1 Tax=unclassified Shewanella TaxID=196818 RepID=UPI0015FD7E4D|nr:YacL family protein [Shewanella sp. SR44-3]MBB1268602.1 YacL family protein [Shewanella sp. SR44-3]